MKSYIVSLLRKSSSTDAKMLLQVLLHYYSYFKYTEENHFECFSVTIPRNFFNYDFFHEHQLREIQNIQGTPIHWRMVYLDKLQIWLQ